MWGVRRLANFMEKRLPADHELLKHLPAFLAKSNECAEKRLLRIGLLDRPLAELGRTKRALLVAEAYGGKLLGALGALVTAPLKLLPGFPGKKKRLTDTYLQDPHVTGFRQLAASPPADAEASDQDLGEVNAPQPQAQ